MLGLLNRVSPWTSRRRRILASTCNFRLDEDELRGVIDRLLLEDILGLPKALCAVGGMERLRAKLALEPQIRGGKKTRLVFTPKSERSMPRGRGWVFRAPHGTGPACIWPNRAGRIAVLVAIAWHGEKRRCAPLAALSAPEGVAGLARVGIVRGKMLVSDPC